MDESTKDGSQCGGDPTEQSGITKTDLRTVDLSDSKEKTSSWKSNNQICLTSMW